MAKLVLAIDMGNSIVTIGLYDGHGILQFRSELSTRKGWTKDQCAMNLLEVFRLYHAEMEAVTGSIISSVVPQMTASMYGAVELLIGKPPLVMGPGVKTGLNIKSDIHAQMGTDIVACSVAAIAKYPSPSIVIDMGTAITMSLIQGSVYEGCVILPGVCVSLEALSQRAAELPHISIVAPASILGRNTVDAMRAGVVFGYASMIDGMIERLEEATAPAASVVGTGISARDIFKHCKRNILYDDNLLLSGLYLVYKRNTEGKQRKPSA